MRILVARNRLAALSGAAFMEEEVLGKLHQKVVVNKSARTISRLAMESAFDEVKLTGPKTKKCDSSLCDFARSNQELYNMTGIPLEQYGYRMFNEKC